MQNKINEWDERLWSPKSLAKAGPSMEPYPRIHESWRDVLKSKRSSLVLILIVNAIYSLMAFGGCIFAIFLLGIIWQHDRGKDLALAVPIILLFVGTFKFFKDVAKLVFYTFISKRILRISFIKKNKIPEFIFGGQLSHDTRTVI